MSTPRAAPILVVLLSCAAAAAAAALLPVYDTDGHALSADADYYVLPAPGGTSSTGGGGLTLAPNGFRCPLFVAQETDPLRKGLPVRFTPLQQQQGQQSDRTTVRVSSDVGVHFAAATTCVQTTEWHVSSGAPSPSPSPPPSPDRRRSSRLVLTGPVLFPSPSGRDKVFRVENQKHGREGEYYKLAWCGGGSSSGGASTAACQDLGVVRDGGGRAWLATAETQTGDQALAVVFQKAATRRA